MIVRGMLYYYKKVSVRNISCPTHQSRIVRPCVERRIMLRRDCQFNLPSNEAIMIKASNILLIIVYELS
jgi:hypothetical protein